MRSAEADYTDEDVVRFLKEEYERIITLYPFQREGSVLSEAQAFEIWLLHQEMGIDYSEAAKHILDGPNDGGVDFIWTDTRNSQVVIGQAQYVVDWTKSPASKAKAVSDIFQIQRLPKDRISANRSSRDLETSLEGSETEGLAMDMVPDMSTLLRKVSAPPKRIRYVIKPGSRTSTSSLTICSWREEESS